MSHIDMNMVSQDILTMFDTVKIKSVSLYQKTMLVTQESWRIMSQMEDEEAHEGTCCRSARLHRQA